MRKRYTLGSNPGGPRGTRAALPTRPRLVFLRTVDEEKNSCSTMIGNKVSHTVNVVVNIRDSLSHTSSAHDENA
ncbi:hypothetical protein QJS04_geneDACA004770 [Acorus gramineus]|uniref:Uncharacterized protein n=1 Tax=Acorus gramineus TaxID=55184 RepID=A0AAV9BTS8_ACOGR|nr:hypothetical protein QJS04_geneDACA004770 [Acorus gramineus]